VTFYQVILTYKLANNDWHMRKFLLLSISEEQALERVESVYDIDLKDYKIEITPYDPMEIFEL
jgi:hypothetical protein